MGRRLNRKDLVKAAPHFLDRPGDIPFEWNVYEEYELVNPGGPFIDSPHFYDQQYLRTPDSNSIKYTYRPLVDSPHLFLEFARLVEQRDREEALNEWISRRGLLGFHKRARPDEEEMVRIAKEKAPHAYAILEKLPYAMRHSYRHNRDYWWSWEQDLTEYMPEGGPSERWGEVVGAALSANNTLRCWEAVLSGDPEGAEQELVGRMPSPEDMDFEGTNLEAAIAEGRETYLNSLRMRASDMGLTYEEHLLYQAAHLACADVQIVLEAFAFPYPAFDYRPSSQRQSGPPGPELVSGSWQPRNLLGAMYLQMYQLMISSGELRSCRYCGRIFSLAPSMPGSKERKPHSKKAFCSDKCRQNYHYHNVIKPKRNARKNGGNA